MMRVEFEAFPRYNASNVPNCHIGGAAFSYPAIRHVFQWGRVLEFGGHESRNCPIRSYKSCYISGQSDENAYTSSTLCLPPKLDMKTSALSLTTAFTRSLTASARHWISLIAIIRENKIEFSYK